MACAQMRLAFDRLQRRPRITGCLPSGRQIRNSRPASVAQCISRASSPHELPRNRSRPAPALALRLRAALEQARPETTFLDFDEGCHISFQYPQLRVAPVVSGYRRGSSRIRVHTSSQGVSGRVTRACVGAMTPCVGQCRHPRTGQGRVNSAFCQSPGLGTVVTGRPSRAGAGDDPVDPLGCRSGCGSRPGCGRGQDLTLWGRACRTRVRPRCPAVRRTDPRRPACRPSGAARRLGRTRRPSGDRPRASSRTRPAGAPAGTVPHSRQGILHIVPGCARNLPHPTTGADPVWAALPVYPIARMGPLAPTPLFSGWPRAPWPGSARRRKGMVPDCP